MKAYEKTSDGGSGRDTQDQYLYRWELQMNRRPEKECRIERIGEAPGHFSGVTGSGRDCWGTINNSLDLVSYCRCVGISLMQEKFMRCPPWSVEIGKTWRLPGAPDLCYVKFHARRAGDRENKPQRRFGKSTSSLHSIAILLS